MHRRSSITQVFICGNRRCQQRYEGVNSTMDTNRYYQALSQYNEGAKLMRSAMEVFRDFEIFKDDAKLDNWRRGPIRVPRPVAAAASAKIDTRGFGMSSNRPGPKPHKLVFKEATGKRIRQIRLEEPYPGSQEIVLAVEFDDESKIEVEINVVSRLSFGIKHLARDSNGEMEPVKKCLTGSIRALVKQQGEPVQGKRKPK